MKRTTKYVALDVHQATTVASVLVCDRRGEKKQGNKGDTEDADRLSNDLRRGRLRAVYHGSAERVTLKELARTYENLVEDTTRTMQRLKSLYRARGIKAPGMGVYQAEQRAEWLARLPERGVRFRAEMLYAELDVLRELRPRAKAAMIAEAGRDPAWERLGRDPAWERLQSIPFMGPVRVSLLLATMQTPWRFRTKRNLWACSGLAVVTTRAQTTCCRRVGRYGGAASR